MDQPTDRRKGDAAPQPVPAWYPAAVLGLLALLAVVIHLARLTA